MKKYFIEEVKQGVGEGGFACGPIGGPVVAEIKVKEDNNEYFYLCLVEVSGFPNFYKTPHSTYEIQTSSDTSDDDIFALEKYLVDTREYEEILNDTTNELFNLYRYLICIVRSDEKTAESFVNETVGKDIDEIEILPTDVDFPYDFVVPNEKLEIYKLRLSLEGEIYFLENNVFGDINEMLLKRMKSHLILIERKCTKEDYNYWMEEYLNTEFLKLKDTKFMTCPYLFAGLGDYDMTIPADELDMFKCWIKNNGSAFMGTPKEATIEEVKMYIAKTI